MAETVTRWLRFVGYRGEPIELQALEVPDGGRWTNNQFAHGTTADDVIRLIHEMEKRKAMGIYLVMNEVDHRVIRRGKPNTWHPAPKKSSKDGASATTDGDIKSRRAMLIDVDYDRPRGTSATDEEVAAALEVAERIHTRLAEVLGSSHALGLGESGNGAAVLIALASLPDPKQDNATISAILTALDFTYGKPDGVKIDKSVIEPKRLCAAWGSTKRKGDDDPAYPHRRTSFSCDDEVQPIGRSELQTILRELRTDLDDEQNAAIDKILGVKAASKAIASKAPEPNTATSDSPWTKANAQDPASVMDRLGIDTCPGCGAGTGDTSFAVVNGGTKCFHDTCSGKGMPGKPGFRTNVDLVAEVRGVKPIDALRQLGEWFGFEVPKLERTSEQAAETWPAPLPLPGGLRPLPVFDVALLPTALRPWVVDIAERAQCPIEYVAAGAIVALGAVIGRRCSIRPKRHDDWTVVPNLWGAAVGPPGVMKSPALAEAMRPLKRLSANAQAQHKKDLAEFEFNATVAKAKRESIQSDIKKAIKDGTDPAQYRDKLSECEAKPPTERRYTINDSTVEKLGELLNENPYGLLLNRDELIGFLRTLERDGHEGDRAFYLEAWSGDSGFTYDRIGRGTTHIEAACISVLGGIQPGPLSDYLLAAMRGGAGDDGLVQRFQVLVYPDVAPGWTNIDRYPDTNAKNAAFGIFERLAVAKPMGAQERDGLPYLHFHPAAQEVFDAWRAALEARLRNPDEAPVMAAHLSKYRKLMPALALIFHLADGAWADAIGGPVSVEAAQLAVKWCALLEAHARRVYQAVTERAQTGARTLAAKIQTGALTSGFTAREVYRHGWTGLADAKEATPALELLEDLHWIRGEAVKTGGAPTVKYEINPAVDIARRQP